MKEREPRKEPIGKGELLYLCHPDDENNIFGYGLTMEPNNPGYLVGMVNVDRTQPVSAGWLKAIGELYGGYHLFPMTADGQRGIACKLQIEAESLPYLRRLPLSKPATALPPWKPKRASSMLVTLQTPILTALATLLSSVVGS